MPVSRRPRPVPPAGIVPGCVGPNERTRPWDFAAVFAIVALIVWGVPASYFAIVLWLFGNTWSTGLGWAICGGFVAVFFGGTHVVSRWSRRFGNPRADRDLAALKRLDFRVCLFCRYDLSRLPEAGACPECGKTYEVDLLKRSWIWTYGPGDRAGSHEQALKGIDRYPEFY